MTDRVVVPFVLRPKTEAVREYAEEMGIPFIDLPAYDASGSLVKIANDDDIGPTADRLASRFLEAGYVDLLHGLKHRQPLESAILSLMIYTRLPPDEQDNFLALLRRAND